MASENSLIARGNPPSATGHESLDRRQASGFDPQRRHRRCRCGWRLAVDWPAGNAWTRSELPRAGQSVRDA